MSNYISLYNETDITTNNLTVTGDVDLTNATITVNTIKFQDGSVTNPSITFINQENEVYCLHPNFQTVYKQIINADTITYDTTDPVNYDAECINLSSKDIISNDEHKLPCYNLPILYKLGKKWLARENGSMLIDGSYFYYIKSYDAVEFNQKPEIFLKLFYDIHEYPFLHFLNHYYYYYHYRYQTIPPFFV